MKYGIFSTDKVNSRSELVKNIMCKEGPSDEERANLKHYYYLEKYTNYATRLSVIPILYIMYKKRFFDKNSPFFIREILAIGLGVSYIGGTDLAVNEYMWKNCYPIVKKHNNMMESYYIDNKTMKKMRAEYLETKEKMYE